MSSNKSVKEKLIKLYGPECFIEKLHLRKDEGPRHYTSKGQYKRMKELTYHHILEKSRGGRTTIENGALLSAENHEWFNKQPKAEQDRMNKIFQEYKKCKVELSDDIEIPFVVHITDISFDLRDKERKQEKRQLQKLKKEYEDR